MRGADEARKLLRRHLLLTLIDAVLLGGVLLTLRLPPDGGTLGLAYGELVVAGAVAVIVLGHAVRVASFVFRREVH